LLSTALVTPPPLPQLRQRTRWDCPGAAWVLGAALAPTDATGVVAVVVCGLIMRQVAPRVLRAEMRLRDAEGFHRCCARPAAAAQPAAASASPSPATCRHTGPSAAGLRGAGVCTLGVLALRTDSLYGAGVDLRQTRDIPDVYRKAIRCAGRRPVSGTALRGFMSAARSFVAPQTMPGWLQAFVHVNPVSHLVTAERGLIAGQAALGQVAWVLLAAAALAAVFAPLTAWLYTRKR